jgi:HEPN domain-containing protein
MTQRDLALQDFRRAELILTEARVYREKGAWNLVVRRAQEAVELALKAAFKKTPVRLWRRRNSCLRFAGNCWGGMCCDRFAKRI